MAIESLFEGVTGAKGVNEFVLHFNNGKSITLHTPLAVTIDSSHRGGKGMVVEGCFTANQLLDLVKLAATMKPKITEIDGALPENEKWIKNIGREPWYSLMGYADWLEEQGCDPSGFHEIINHRKFPIQAGDSFHWSYSDVIGHSWSADRVPTKVAMSSKIFTWRWATWSSRPDANPHNMIIKPNPVVFKYPGEAFAALADAYVEDKKRKLQQPKFTHSLHHRAIVLLKEIRARMHASTLETDRHVYNERRGVIHQVHHSEVEINFIRVEVAEPASHGGWSSLVIPEPLWNQVELAG